MSKGERIQKIMIYLSDRAQFNLKELMDEFNISRSTALRDVEALESIGYPIFSTKGKYGGYGILHNKMTYHFEFTNQEIYALYFAMQTLRSYQSTPFHIDLSKMTATFLTMHSEEVKSTLKRMEDLISLEVTDHNHDSPFLKDILLMTINRKVLVIGYRGKMRHVQVMNITSRFGQWYATVYDHLENTSLVLRCDRIESVDGSNNYKFIEKSAIESLLARNESKEKRETFMMEIDPRGVDLYTKEKYPTMSLEYQKDKVFLKGSYTLKEKPFILRYLFKFGETIQQLEPSELKRELLDYSRSLVEHIETL